MQTEDWAEFDVLLAKLCEVYDRKKTTELTDGYWQALGRMSIRDFKIAANYAINHAGVEGYDRLPKPGRMWAMRDVALRESRRTATVRELAGKPEEKFTAIHGHGNKCLLAYLYSKGTATKSALAAMIQAKNSLVARYESIATEEQITGKEIRDAMFKQFDKHWEKHA